MFIFLIAKYHVGIHWIVLTDYSDEDPGTSVSIKKIIGFLHHFLLVKLATTTTPSNAEATFVRSTWVQRFLKTM